MSDPSPVLASEPSACCLKEGFKHEGTPVGKIITIAGVETYVSEPSETTTPGQKKVIMYFSDVWGALSNNAKLLQDYYASHGFHVLGLDYLFGDYIDAYLGKDPEWDWRPWLENCTQRAVEPTPKWIKAVREIYGPDAKYYAVGYCFGAPYTMDLAATNDIVAAAFAHPANLNESHFEKLKAPLLLSCAESDVTFPLESRRRAEDIMAQSKATYHIQIFSGAEHGFSRGDISVEHIRWAKEESTRSIVGWFNRFT